MDKYISVNQLRKAIDELESESLVGVKNGSPANTLSRYVNVDEFEQKLNEAKENGLYYLDTESIMSLVHNCEQYHLVNLQMGKHIVQEGALKDV